MNSMRVAVYAMKIPSGFLIFNCIHLKVVPKFKFPPAESPAKTLIVRFEFTQLTKELTLKIDLFLPYRQVSLFSPYFRVRCWHVLTPTHKHTALLRAHEDRVLLGLDCNLCSRLVHRALQSNFVDTFRAIVKSATRIHPREYE